MKTLFVSLLFLLLSACASTTNKMYNIPEGLAAITPSRPIVCKFEKQLMDGEKPVSKNWYFWRETQRTETRDELSNQGEIWQRNHLGQFFYTRLFFNEHVALDFVPGDLAATETVPSWAQLTSIIDPKTLGRQLQLLGKDTANQVAVESYSGLINGVATEVDWLPSLQLPARFVKKLPEGTITLVLSACAEQDKYPVKAISKTELDNLRHIDFTDLGDMENDPMVRHLEQLMGGHQHGGH